AANGGADGDEPSYDSMKDQARKPLQSNDPGWKYGYWHAPPQRKSVVCNLCGKITPGWIKRHKEHLAGLTGDVIG
uniref:BED-type domain-containing protein n=1 Tax=Aegilops tauschii subsp. strangulata TaxID=200361 RepID=A0A452Y8W4_AEGTS